LFICQCNHLLLHLLHLSTKNSFATVDYKKLLEEKKHVVLPDTLYKLECTVSELYNGCTKTFEISRNIIVSKHGEYKQDTKMLSIVVKPGWMVGTRVVFPKEGDQSATSTTSTSAADVVFVIAQGTKSNNNGNENYSQWSIKGVDLIYMHKLSLLEALSGGVISITTLDGRMLTLSCPEIVHPSYEKRIIGKIIIVVGFHFIVLNASCLFLYCFHSPFN